MTLNTTVGDPAADSYVTAAEATTYHTAMGNSDWSASGITDPIRESALRRAVVWLDGVYRGRYPGRRVNGRAQALEWPRSGAVDIEGEAIDEASIPEEIKKAQMEAALVELVTPGALSPTASSSQVVKSEKVGPITTEYAVSDGSVEAQFPVVSSVDRILSGLLTSANSSIGFLAVQNYG